MHLLLDYLGSFIIGAALLIIVINANEVIGETQSVHSGDLLVQEMLVQTVHLIEGEFRNMGLGVPESSQTILSADSSAIRFLYDVDRDRTPDTLRYYVGAPSELPGTQNELDRLLYRRVNAADPQKVGVVTVFRLRYLTRLGQEIPSPVDVARLGEIHSVEITMEVQNPYAVISSVHASEKHELYSSSLWQQTRLSSQNSRR